MTRPSAAAEAMAETAMMHGFGAFPSPFGALDALRHRPRLPDEVLAGLLAALRAQGGDDLGLVEWALDPAGRGADQSARLRERWRAELLDLADPTTGPLSAVRTSVEPFRQIFATMFDSLLKLDHMAVDPDAALATGIGIVAEGYQSAGPVELPDVERLSALSPDGLPLVVEAVLDHPAWPDTARNAARDALLAHPEPIRAARCWVWLGSLWAPSRAERLGLSEADPLAAPPWLKLWAWYRWADAWRDEAQEARVHATRAMALTTRVAGTVADLLSPATRAHPTDDGLDLVAGGRTVGRLDADEIEAMLIGWRGPVIDAGMVRENADRIVSASRTAAAVAGFWHGLRTVTELRRSGLELRAEWPSWRAWANEVAELADLRLDSHLRRLLCDFAWYGNTVQLRLFDDRWAKGLWTLTGPDPHKRGRPRAGSASAVAFRYGDVLDPTWACRENPRDRNRGVHLLALPDRLPVHVADPAQKGPAQLYALMVLAEICDRSHHEHVADGIELTPSTRAALASRAGLHHTNERAQLDGLLDDGLIVAVGPPDRFALGMEEARRLRSHVRPTPRRPRR